MTTWLEADKDCKSIEGHLLHLENRMGEYEYMIEYHKRNINSGIPQPYGQVIFLAGTKQVG